MIYICTTRLKNLKLLTVFPVNDFSVFLITKCFILDVKGFLDSPLHAIHQACKSSQLIILNVFKYNMSRFLKFWCKLNIRRIAKTCSFRFLRDYYGDFLDVMFSQFPNHSYRFPWYFPIFPLMFLQFLGGVSVGFPASYFRFCGIRRPHS